MDRGELLSSSARQPPGEAGFFAPGTGRDTESWPWEDRPLMLHITCDYCHRQIVPGLQDRYVVKIEVFAAHDPAELTESDLDEDHLEAVSQLLCDAEADPAATAVSPANQTLRYDLCPECQRKFVNDPLGKEAAQKFHFSEN
jgi:hypothetical protein